MSAAVSWDKERRLIIYALVCEGDHGLLFATRATFEASGYIAARQAANSAGWTRSGNQHFGPCCPNRFRKAQASRSELP